jgi:hypothetical protein
MPSKRIEIFKKASNHFISVKISLTCHAFFKKKAWNTQKKAWWQLRLCHNGQSAPESAGLPVVSP